MAVETYGGVATRAGKLTSRIPLIIKDLPDTVYDGLKEAAEKIAEDAKQRCPVGQPPDDEHPGALQGAIHVETEEELGETSLAAIGATRAISIVAGNYSVFYGHMVENGHYGHPGHPFLIPAFEAHRDEIESIIEEKLEDI